VYTEEKYLANNIIVSSMLLAEILSKHTERGILERLDLKEFTYFQNDFGFILILFPIFNKLFKLTTEDNFLQFLRKLEKVMKSE